MHKVYAMHKILSNEIRGIRIIFFRRANRRWSIVTNEERSDEAIRKEVKKFYSFY